MTVGSFFFPTGIILLAIANGAVGPIVAGVLYALLGYLFCKFVSALVGSRTNLQPATFAALAICLTGAGIAQMYALWFSGQLQNTIDAVEVFYPLSRVGLVDGAFATTKTNSEMAIWIWQFLYEGAGRLGLGDGPWIGVTFNCFMITLSITLILATVELVRSGLEQVRDITPWLIFGFLFWEAATIHVRDAYTILGSAVVLFFSAFLIERPSLTRLIVGISSTAVVAGLIFYVREESGFMLGLLAFWGLSCGVFFSKWESSSARSVALFVLVLVGVIAVGGAVAGRELFLLRSDELIQDNITNADAGSLGTRFIMQASLPVRITVGTFFMFVHPIPLWGYIGPWFDEITWIESLGGFTMLATAPYLVDALWTPTPNRRMAVHKLYASVASGLGILSIVMSNMGVRHILQFLPFLLVVMAFSNPLAHQGRRRMLWQLWLGVIALVHVAWAVLKG